MAKKPTKTEKKVAEAFHEVYESKPSTMGKNQTKAEERSQLTAIALNKARAKGAKVPKKGSKTQY